MPLPLALPPLAFQIGQLALVAMVAWTAARHIKTAGLEARAREDALNGVPHGMELTRATVPDAARMDLAAATRRSLRFGGDGPGLEADMSLIARLRLRRIRAGVR